MYCCGAQRSQQIRRWLNKPRVGCRGSAMALVFAPELQSQSTRRNFSASEPRDVSLFTGTRRMFNARVEVVHSQMYALGRMEGVASAATSGCRADTACYPIRWNCQPGIHAARRVGEIGREPFGGPRLGLQRETEYTKRSGWPHVGQGGFGISGQGARSASPNCTGLPEWNWTRIRLVVAVGWQKP